jgi:hypothetical protein
MADGVGMRRRKSHSGRLTCTGEPHGEQSGGRRRRHTGSDRRRPAESSARREGSPGTTEEEIQGVAREGAPTTALGGDPGGDDAWGRSSGVC